LTVIPNPVYLLITLLSGVTMAVQGSLNSALGKAIGLFNTTLIVHLIGTVTIGALIILTPHEKGQLGHLFHLPWYMSLGGVLSVVIVYLVATSIPKVGVAAATTAIIVGQVSTALAIDHWGLWGLDPVAFTWWKLLGMALLACGALLMLYN
jgi:transporter family-2 protein